MTVDIRGSLDSCVKCTVCETFCPVAAATPLFPGPKYAGPQSERYRHPGISVDASLDYCSGCGICTQVCPQGVDIAEINARARAEMRAAKGMPLRDRLIARPALLGRLTRPVAPLANAAMRTRPARRGARGHAWDPPRRGPPELRHDHVPGLGAAARAAHVGHAQDRLLPWLRGQLQRAERRPHGRRRAGAQRLRGDRAIPGLLRAAAAVKRGVRAGPRTHACARRTAGAACPRGAHDRGQLHQLRADAEARGAGDPGHRRRGSGAGRRPGRSISASFCATCTMPANCAPTSIRSRCASPTTSRARAAATGSASPPSTCWRSSPSSR